ncbi:jg25322 [Pararge aegeria aegeria]|uniref:Lipase n=1 Tax=Pararge aegeria aegeria TaxID=348720 RepID=A0A8S4S1Y8_9NEOP|nr:jg25322 [Pararge aegeria aegeria]
MFLDIVFMVSIVLVADARSPHADFVDELAKSHVFGNRISDNVMEDALLDLPDLVRKYNYPFEEHFVATEDGYILGVHRIPHGRDSKNLPENKPVAFLMHGLLCSSAEYITMGPGTALAYILAEEGFDVWLGNARGTYYSRRHTNLNPDARFNSTYWKFSWDEIGNKDLPSMIDYVLDYTGKSALHYIGMSQGTTTFFAMASLRPEYNKKIISMQAMAPVAYLAYNSNPLFLVLSPYGRELEKLASLLGIGELFPRREIYTLLGKSFCADGAITQPICSNLLFYIAGRNDDQHNATMWPVKLGHAPAGISVRQLIHYSQSIINKEFRRYDHGFLNNIEIYGRATPPSYDLSKISAPVFLHYAANDPLAHLNDVGRLYRELGNPMGKFLVPHPEFSHADFLFGIDANTLVYNTVIRIMKQHDI